jgi:hypothetical protein
MPEVKKPTFRLRLIRTDPEELQVVNEYSGQVGGSNDLNYTPKGKLPEITFVYSPKDRPYTPVADVVAEVEVASNNLLEVGERSREIIRSKGPEAVRELRRLYGRARRLLQE